MGQGEYSKYVKKNTCTILINIVKNLITNIYLLKVLYSEYYHRVTNLVQI